MLKPQSREDDLQPRLVNRAQTTRNPVTNRLEIYQGESEKVPHAFEEGHPTDAALCRACEYPADSIAHQVPEEDSAS